MRQIKIYILLIIIVLGGCSQEGLDIPQVGSPVFSIDSILDNEALNWVAGDDDVFMFTEFSKDNFDVYTLTGRLAKDDNCIIDCEEALTFSIRSSYVTSTPNDFNISDALFVGDYEYITLDSLGIVGYNYTFEGALFDTIFGTSANTFIWTIDTNIITTQDPVFTHSDLLGNDFNVRLEMLNNQNLCISYIEKTILTGQNNLCDMSFDVIPDSLLSEFYITTVFPSMNPNGITYLWNNSITSDSFFINSNAPIPNNILSLSVNDPQGTCNIDMGICIDSTPTGSIQGISIPLLNYFVEPVVSTINEQFSKVIIEYQDKNGIVYSSRNGDNNNNTFTINNIEDFEDNENGEKTKKLTIQYDAILYNDNNDSKAISGEGVIAVAYPD